MLPAAHRLRDGEDYRRVLRRGRRAGSATLVVSALRPSAGTPGETGPVRVGLVVSKAVGDAVRRNRVKRRLRHLARERVGTLPAGTSVVVRALPSAAAAGSTRLAADLDRCLEQVMA